MAEVDLDQAVRRADPDRWLAGRFIADREARADVIALYAYDHALSRAGRAASNALVAEIRLTWWREVVDEIFAGKAVRAHPTAEGLAETIRRHSLPREPLEAMIDARIEVLEQKTLDAPAADAWADAVGGSATTLAARILDPAAKVHAAAPAGRVWGLVLLRRSGLATGASPDRRLAEALEAAAVAARDLGPAAFPAVAHATIARADLHSGHVSDLEKRWRLFWAVARGRL